MGGEELFDSWPALLPFWEPAGVPSEPADGSVDPEGEPSEGADSEGVPEEFIPGFEPLEDSLPVGLDACP